jgi:group I intron endonuclease
MKKQDNVITGIYKITNPKGKVYIGQSVNIYSRKRKYITNNVKGQPLINRSISKYGWENHIFDIIEESPLEQLNERETYWKQYYLDQFGGDWNMVLFFNLYDTGGGPKSERWKQSRYIPIIQYSIDGDFIQEWESAQKASIFYSSNHRTAINRCLKEGIKSACGFIWKYKTENYPIKIKPIFKDWERFPINQYSMGGILINSWNSTLEAADFLGKNQQNICNNLKNRAKSAYGFIWKYK